MKDLQRYKLFRYFVDIIKVQIIMGKEKKEKTIEQSRTC